MKNFLIFSSGLIVGVLLTVFTLLIFSSITMTSSENNIQVQSIDIKGRKGNVTLHTGISKDSVFLLVGKPDEVDLRTLGNSTYEDWGYKLKKGYMSDLRINFVDGKLIGVSQD